MRQRPAGAVAADAVAADLRLDGDVLLHLPVPVLRPLRPDEERDHPDARLGARVVEVLAGVDDLLQPTLERELVALEELEHAVLLAGLELCLHRVRAERDDRAAHVDRAAVNVLADLLAGVAADHQAAAVHHVAGHEAGVAAAAERACLHHLSGARADVAAHDDLGSADRDARDRPRVAADDDGALVHVVGEAPADVAVDLDARPVGQARAEVAGRAADADGDRVGEADADVVARIRVEDVDVLAGGSVLEQQAVGVGDRDVG